MRAEPIIIIHSLKLYLWYKVCAHSSIIVFLKKAVKADKQRKSGNDSLTNEIRWCLWSNRCFENEINKKTERNGEKSNHSMDICCYISISYLWSACLHRSEFWLKNIKYTRLHKFLLLVSKLQIQSSKHECMRGKQGIQSRTDIS